MKKLAVGLTVLLLVLTHHALAQTTLANGWYFNEQSDPFNDERITVVFKDAYVSPSYGTGLLFIRCDDRYVKGDVEVMFVHDDYLGMEDFYRVIHRFDDVEPVTHRWSTSTDNEALFLPASEIPRFLSGIRNGSSLAIRTWDYSDTSLTWAIDLAGGRGALTNLHCELP